MAAAQAGAAAGLGPPGTALLVLFVPLVAVGPGADADLVALGVGQDPERRAPDRHDQRRRPRARRAPRVGLVVGRR